MNLRNESHMALIAQQLAACCITGDVILLNGPLGAGKSSFARAFINTFYPAKIEVTSPTFTLIQTYSTPTNTLWHCDFYRIESEEDALELGIEDAFEDAITLIEWPKTVENILPQNRLYIDIAYGEEEGTRTLTFTPYGRLKTINLPT